jgi:hypothetical protein
MQGGCYPSITMSSLLNADMLGHYLAAGLLLSE